MLTSMALVAMTAAAETAAVSPWPPSDYALADVEIRVSQQPGHGLPGIEVTLHGDGSATLLRHGATTAFKMASSDLVALVNDFYRIRFFDLPENMTQSRSVALGKDGRVSSVRVKLADSGHTTVCFAVQARKSCVSYALPPPTDLDDLVVKIIGKAEAKHQAP